MLTVISYLVLSIGVYAQITKDKVEPDGGRLISTGYTNLYRHMVNAAAFNLSYTLTADSIEGYFLTICLNEGKMQFGRGKKLLIKFADNSMMELENSTEIGPADYEYKVSQYGTNYFTYPQYDINVEQIKRIINGEVVKKRIENDIEYFDRDIKKNKFSKGLKELFEAIDARKQAKNNVYEGF